MLGFGVSHLITNRFVLEAIKPSGDIMGIGDFAKLTGFGDTKPRGWILTDDFGDARYGKTLTDEARYGETRSACDSDCEAGLTLETRCDRPPHTSIASSSFRWFSTAVRACSRAASYGC
jgi:hypothetical protein